MMLLPNVALDSAMSRGIRWILAMIAIALIAWTVANLLPQGVAWDAPTYLAAGERLNAGHDLYALVPGDRPVVGASNLRSPLLSPPLVAVFWRPLALFGESSMVVWWLACIVAIVTAVFIVVSRATIAAVIALLILSVPIGWELLAANLNGFIILGLSVVWLLHERGHDRAAGAFIGLLAVAKVWPALLLLALPRRALAGGVAGIAVAGFVGVFGAGISAHVAYLSVGAGIGASPWSVSAITGIPWPGLFAIGVVAVLGLRSRPAYAWAAAVISMVLASPVLYVNHLGLMLPAVLPWWTKRTVDLAEVRHDTVLRR